MAAREPTKTITTVPTPEEPVVEEQLGRRKRPETGRFRLLVDRQTKSSFTTLDAAEKAGMAIKTAHPIVQVMVYDATDAVNKLIELPPG